MKAIFIASILILTLMLGAVFAQEEQFIYNDHGKRDPFWRLVSPNGMIMNYDSDLLISDMILEGIIFDPHGKSLAIINGKIIQKNDTIGPYVISRIEKDRVVMIKGEESFLLKLKKEE